MTIPGAIVYAVAIGAPFSWIRPEDRARSRELHAAALRIVPVYYRLAARERRKLAR